MLHDRLRHVARLLAAKLSIVLLLRWERRTRDVCTHLQALVQIASSRLIEVATLTVRILLAHVLRHALRVPNVGVRRRNLNAQDGRRIAVVRLARVLLRVHGLHQVTLGRSRIRHGHVLLLLTGEVQTLSMN